MTDTEALLHGRIQELLRERDEARAERALFIRTLDAANADAARLAEALREIGENGDCHRCIRARLARAALAQHEERVRGGGG